MPAWCAPLLIGHRGDLFARLLKRGAGNLFPGLLTVVEQLHPNKSERRINLTHPIEKRFGDCGIQKLPKKQLGLQSREGRRLHAIKNGVGRTNSASSRRRRGFSASTSEESLVSLKRIYVTVHTRLYRSRGNS